jgi:hypothetical protein
LKNYFPKSPHHHRTHHTTKLPNEHDRHVSHRVHVTTKAVSGLPSIDFFSCRTLVTHTFGWLALQSQRLRDVGLVTIFYGRFFAVFFKPREGSVVCAVRNRNGIERSRPRPASWRQSIPGKEKVFAHRIGHVFRRAVIWPNFSPSACLSYYEQAVTVHYAGSG